MANILTTGVLNQFRNRIFKNIYIGGSFTTYQGTTRNRLVSLNPSGDINNNFDIGTGFNGEVRSIDTQSDGRIIVAGAFTTYQGTTRNRLVRLNNYGTYSFSLGTGFNSIVNCVAIQSDDKILVGGLFTSYQGGIRNRFLRLLSNGNIDTAFIASTAFENGEVNDIKIQSDTKILVAGSFSTYQGVARNRIVRIGQDGTYDTSFSVSTTNVNNTIYTIAIQTDGKILVGGLFDSFKYMIRLNSNGSRDTSFSVQFDNAVNTIAIQTDGKILVGGLFSNYDTTSINKIVRLNTNGTIDTTFNVGTGFGAASVNKLYLQSDGKILVGGSFTTYQGTTRNRLVRLNADGSYDNTFNLSTGFNNTVQTIYIK